MPSAIAIIPPGHIAFRLIELNRVACGHQLTMSSRRPDLRIGFEEKFHIRFREHPGPDVAPLRHDTPLGADLPLHRQQPFADSRNRRDHRRQCRHRGRAQFTGDIPPIQQHMGLLGTTGHMQRRLGKQRGDGELILRAQSRVSHFPRNGAIQGACIQIEVSKPQRQESGDRALADPCRTINGDDQPALPAAGCARFTHVILAL